MKRRDFVVGTTLAGLGGCSRLPPEAKGRVVVPFWFSYGGKNREVLLDLVARYHASQRDVYVDAIFQGDYFEALAKVRTALAAGAAPPLTHVVAEVIPYLHAAGVLEPMDAFPGGPFVRALAQEGAFAAPPATPRVAVPFNRSTPIMFVNADLLAKERVPVPTTWDELREAARALTAPAQSRFGFVVPVSWWFWVALMGQAGGTLVDDKTGTPTLGGEGGEAALRFLQDLVHVDRTMRPPPGRDYNAWSAANQDFLAGRAALLWTSTAYVRYLEDNAKFTVRAAPLPKAARFAVPTGGTFFVVMKAAPAEQKRAAFDFLRYMSDDVAAASFATRTGYIPVNEASVARLRREGYYARFPNDLVALEQLAAVDPWPFVPSLFRIQRDIVEPRVEDAVLRRLDAGAVFREARTLASRAAEATRPNR